MTTTSFVLNGLSTGGPDPKPVITVFLTENSLNGTVTITVTQAPGGTVGDISAIWFDLVDEALRSSLVLTSFRSPTGDSPVEGIGPAT